MAILSDHGNSTANSLKRKRNCDLHYNQFDVFLSFRGSDTRYGFTDHLYEHLKRAGIQTFRDDDELERGESLKKQLENAIKQSSVSIIVFSENYASSSWCLDELVRILEQKKIRSSNFKVLPIFYKVDATNVRYQRGSYKEAFNRHREKGDASLEKIQSWEAALTEAVNFVGLALSKGWPETDFIAKIVSEVEKYLPNRKALDVPERFLGMYYWADEIDSWFRSKDNNVLVICGIGGAGKTTIAKHLFNEHFRDFDGSCFLARITGMWDQIGVGVCGLQSQLLSNILNIRGEIRIHNCNEGTQKIKRAIYNRTVLLVLDDVSETEQLHALLGQEQRFYPGSKILVTTRNMSLRKGFFIHPKVHIVESLNDEDSLKLFSWHAFRQLSPLEEFRQLSKEILLRCGGLPLALEVLGSSLRKKLDNIFWEKQLQKWEKIANPGIQKVMQISYDSLEDDTIKNLFLHVACFFVGEEEDYVVKILDHCGLHAMVGIQNLMDRCLITTTYDNKLMMHQVIQDMGREIVRQESPNEPGQRSRLWCHEDSFTVLKYDMGTEVVQGLILEGQKINKVQSDGSSFAATESNPHLITKVLGYVKKRKVEALDRFLPSKERELKIDAFEKMVNLKLLKLNHVHLTGSCNKFPEKLRWISWHGFSLEYVPMELPLENLVSLDLQHSILKQVWKGYKEARSLKFLNLSYSLKLGRTPDFRGLPQLERLILRGCSNLVKVCKTIGILNKLVLLDLRDCRSMRDLPALPESIVTLDLSGCDLGEFLREKRTFDCYSIMKFASRSIATGPIKFLACLPHILVRLSLKDCNLSDECFPRDFSRLSSLEALDLSGNLITRLPDCIRNLPNNRLRELFICYCPQLQSIIHPPTTVTYLHLFGNRQLQIIKARKKLEDLFLEIDEHTVTEYVGLEGCFKRVEAQNVERKVIKNLGLESVPIDCVGKVLYEVGIFSTFVQSTRLPSCFKTTYTYGEENSEDGREELEEDPCRINIPYGKMETSRMPYIIPCSSAGKNKIQGLNRCFAIRLDLDVERDKYLLLGYIEIIVTVSNKTKDLAWSYKFQGRFVEVLLMEKYKFLWVSTWKCEDLLDAGDELQVSFKIPDPDLLEKLKVQECGIRTVYEEEEDLSGNTTPSRITILWSDEMDVSFSNYRTSGTHYFLLGRSPRLSLKREDIEQEIDGRAVQFVDWWGPNLNQRYKEVIGQLKYLLCSREGQPKYFLYDHCFKL